MVSSKPNIFHPWAGYIPEGTSEGVDSAFHHFLYAVSISGLPSPVVYVEHWAKRCRQMGPLWRRGIRYKLIGATAVLVAMKTNTRWQIRANQSVCRRQKLAHKEHCLSGWFHTLDFLPPELREHVLVWYSISWIFLSLPRWSSIVPAIIISDKSLHQRRKTDLGNFILAFLIFLLGARAGRLRRTIFANPINRPIVAAIWMPASYSVSQSTFHRCTLPLCFSAMWISFCNRNMEPLHQ